MEKKEPISSNPQGVCEKFFNALSVTPTFKTLRRISHHPQTASPPVAPAPTPTPTPTPVAPAPTPTPTPPLPVSTNPVSVQNKPGMRLEPTHKVNSKVSEAVVPTKTDPPLPLTTKSFKEKLPTPPVQPVREINQVAKANPKPDPKPPKVSVKQEKGKPNTKVHSASPVKAVPEDGKEKVVKKVELPQPPPKVVAEKAEDKKIRSFASINDKASDYINRARNKIRTTSTVGGGKVSTPK